MKKLYSILLFLLVPAVTFAQDLYLGVAAMPGLSTVITRNMLTDGMRLRFNAGVEVRKMLGDNRFSIQSGVYWLDKGKYMNQNNWDMHFYYLNIPVVFNKQFKRFYVGAGPAIEYRVGVTRVHDGGDRENLGNDRGHKVLFAGKGNMGYIQPLSKSWVLQTEGFIFPSASRQYVNAGISVGIQHRLSRDIPKGRRIFGLNS